MEFVKTIVQATTSPKAKATVLAGSGAVLLFLLLASDGVLDRFGLLNIQTEFLATFGILAVYSFATLLVYIGASVFGWLATNIRRHLVITKRRKALHFLTGEEKAILRRFVGGQTKSQGLVYESGVVQGLRDARIIYRASSVGELRNWQFNIHDWAWDYLHLHPECLQE